MPNNSLSSFPGAFCHLPLASVFCAWPVFVLLSVFISRFCSSPSPCSFPQIFSQNRTASSARKSTRRPKVGRHTHTLTHFLSPLTHTKTHAHASPPRLCPSVPSRALHSMDEARVIPPLPPSPGASRTCTAWPRCSDTGQISLHRRPHRQDHRHGGQSLISPEVPRRKGRSKGVQAYIQAQHPNEQFDCFTASESHCRDWVRCCGVFAVRSNTQTAG